MTSSDRTCIIIPCYNEERRLNLDECSRRAPPARFVFVNDGSTDGTLAMLRGREDGKNVLVLDLGENQGKAEAVRRGVLFAACLPDAADFQWYGYWDADLATPLSETDKFLAFAAVFQPGAEAVFGSRVRRLGSAIRRTPIRYLISRVFMNLFNLLFGLRAYDTQCGAKLFRREVVGHVFGAPFLTRWIFDVEICLRLKGRPVLEYPLSEWSEIAGSKISSLRAVRGIFMDVARLWLSRTRRPYG